MARIFALFATLALATAGLARAADGLTPFRTPSGNIHCLIIEGDDGEMVDCEMREITKFTLPQKRPADCDLDWGNRFGLAEELGPYMGCAGDTVQDPNSKVLDYGKSLSIGSITCTSRQQGLTCEAGTGRHGFFLSKAKQRFY